MKWRRPFSSNRRHGLMVIPASDRHPVIGILNGAVALRVLQLLVPVAADPVEFHQPVFKPAARLHLPGADFVRFGFQAITALARAPPAEVPTRRISRRAASLPFFVQPALQVAAMGQHL